MKIFRSTLAFLVLLCSASIASAQTLTKGTIKMAITDVKVDQPEMKQMVEAMKGTNQKIEFNQNQQKVTIDMMGGMIQVRTFQDFEKGTSENYMDMMGQKFKMQSEDMKTTQEKAKELLGDSEVKYEKSDKKTILGRECYKGSLSVETEGQTIHLTFYLTEEIKVPQAFIQNMGGVELAGAPLEMIMDLGMMKMTYTAVDISDQVDKDFFTRPEGDYKEMTPEQLQQMGGNQFGF